MDLVQIAMRLTGAREAAAEARAVSAAVGSTGEAATAAGVAAGTSSTRTDRMRRAWSTAGRVAKGAALGAAGAAAALAWQTKAAVTQSTELAAVTAGLHRNLGLTNREGSRWAAVAKARGIDSKSLNMSFTTLSRNIAAGAEDNAAYEDSFAKLGITQAEVRDGTKDFTGFVTRLADAFGDAEGGAERQAMAQKLLGRGYQSILPLFSDGSKSLQEQLGWADKYHVTMGGQLVEDNMRLVAAQRESRVAWLGIQQTLSAAVLPVLTRAQGEFQHLAAVISDPKLSDDEKIAILGRKFEQAANRAFDAFSAMLPKLASRVGESIPRVAGAFVNGFLNANAWGKLLLGGWLLKKLGGGAAASAIGTKVGGWIGAKMLAKMGVELGGGAATTSLTTAMSPMAAGLGTALAPWLGAALLAGLAVYMLAHKDEIIDMVKGQAGLREMSPEEIAEIEGNTGNDIDNDGVVQGQPSVGNHGAAGATAGGKRPKRLKLATTGGAQKTTPGGKGRPQHVHLYLNSREIAGAVLDEAQTAAALA